MSQISDEQFSIAALTVEIARLKAELEEAREMLEGFRHHGEELIIENIALKNRAETAEAAAGAMREAVQEWLDSDQAADTPKLIRKLCEPDIGAEVMRVVRAAEKYQEADHDEALDDTDDDRHFEAICIKARASEELSQALAALGGTHER